MKILHVTPTFLPAIRYGGTTVALNGLCQNQAKLGHSVDVVSTTVDGSETLEVPIGSPVKLDAINVYYYPSPCMKRTYYSPQMATFLKENIQNYDIVHLHSVFLWPTLKAARIAKANKVPYVITPHGMLIKDLIKNKSQILKTIWIIFAERKNLEDASVIHLTSEIEREELQQFHFNLKKTAVIPLGLELSELNNEKPPESPVVLEVLKAKEFILFLGRITQKKGIDRLIYAMANLRDKMLVVAGNDEDGYTNELMGIVKSLSLEKNIQFVGPVYGSDKSALFQRADLFVLPSRSENFGLVVLEAMGHGCPVMLTPEVGLSADVEAGGAGAVVPGDSELWSEAMGSLLQDKKKLAEMGKRGRALVKDKFSWKATTSQMNLVYKGVTKG